MLDRTVQVIDHKLKDWLDFLLGVAGIDGEGGVLMQSVKLISDIMTMTTYPFTTVQDKACQVHSGSSDVTRRVLDEAVVEASNLEKVLAKSTSLDVVVVGL